MIIAVDFDGTIVEHDYPMIGKEVPYAIDVLRDLHEEEDVQLILYTMRSGIELVKADEYLKSKGITKHWVNENKRQISWTSSPKVYAHLYIDDAAVGTPLIKEGNNRAYVDWKEIAKLLLNYGLLWKSKEKWAQLK